MGLDRHQQVAQVWDWLPAFRAAAEYQSLQRASLALSVSPSALSRTIRLLEDALGVALFTRSPAGLGLTPEGTRLLAATREAMRQIHDQLPAAAPNHLRAGTGDPGLFPLLCRAAAQALPAWTMGLKEVPGPDAGERLRCGELDLLLAHECPAGEFRAEALPALEVVVAVPPGGDRSRVASLDAAGLTWPQAALTASQLPTVVALAESMGVAVFAPAYAVPGGWTVVDRPAPVPVHAVTRTYGAGPPPHLAQVARAVRTLLEAQASR